MIVVRFKMQCRPESTGQVMEALQGVLAASRRLDGVTFFDIARDIGDDNCFIATEVFEDRAALERQESLPEVAKALQVLEASLAEEPEATIYHISSAEPWG
jgi:quinol monooxygenase YgiN